MIKNLIRYFIILIALLITLFIGLLTPTGLKVSFFLVSQILPGKIHYKNINGTWLGPISINNLDYRKNNVHISIQHIDWQWRLSTLWKNQIYLQAIHARGVKVFINPAEKSLAQKIWELISSPNAQQNIYHLLQSLHGRLNHIYWPLPMALEDLSVENIVLEQDNTFGIVRLRNLNANGIFQRNLVALNLQSQMTYPKTTAIQVYLNGNLNHYQFQILSFNQQFIWNILGDGNPQQVSLQTTAKQTTAGYAKGFLKLTWGDTPHWQVNLHASNINAKLMKSSWPKNLDGTIESNGWFNDKDLFLKWKNDLLLDHNRFSLQASFDQLWDVDWDINFQQLTDLLENAQGTMVTKGTLKGDFSNPLVTGDLQIRSLHTPTLSVGDVTSHWNFDLSNKQSSPWDITASNISIKKFPLQELQLQGQGALNKHQLSGSITAETTRFDFSLSDHLNPKVLLHELINAYFAKPKLVCSQPKNSGEVPRCILQPLLNPETQHAANQPTTAIWEGNLDSLKITSTIFGDWQLINPTAVDLSGVFVHAHHLCIMDHTGGKACMNLDWKLDQEWQLQLTAQDIDAGFVSNFLAEHNITVNGKISGQAHFRGEALNLEEAQWQMKFTAGKLIYSIMGKPVENEFYSGYFTGLLDQKGLHGKVHFDLANGNSLNLDWSLPHYFGKGLPKLTTYTKTTIRSRVENLSFLQRFIPQILAPQGKITGKFSVKGPLVRPILQGVIQLEKGSVQIPQLNLTLTNISVESTIKQNILRYKIMGYSGGQQVLIEGETNLSLPGFPSTITITGSNILIVNTPEYLIYASPRLILHTRGKEVSIEGYIDIPKAIISPQEFRNIVSLPEEDVVIIGACKSLAPKADFWKLISHVEIHIGNDVTIATSGILAKVHGDIVVYKKPPEVTVASGKIFVTSGTYTTHGRALQISPLSFIEFDNTPITNPLLNLRVSKTIQTFPNTTTSTPGTEQLGESTVTVGFDIQGSFKNPKITPFSIPATLSKADILSYLLWGEGINPLTAGSYNMTINALKEGSTGGYAGIAKTDTLISDIRRGLGFNKMGIQSEAPVDAMGKPIDQQTSAPMGRHLTRRIYIRYRQAIPGPGSIDVNEFTVRYLLDRHWAIQSNANNYDVGMDILYTLEKNYLFQKPVKQYINEPCIINR